MTPPDHSSTELPDDSGAIRIVRGSPTPSELAAVLAVVEALAVESEDDAVPTVTTSAWQRSQRPVRAPLHSLGAWRSFSG